MSQEITAPADSDSGPKTLKDWAEVILDGIAQGIRWEFIMRRHFTEGERGNKTKGPQERYPQWDGGRDRWGRTYKAIWPTIAKYVVQHGLNADRLVGLLFDEHRPVPEPQQMMTPEHLECYHQDDNTGIRELRILVKNWASKMTFDAEMKRQTGNYSDEAILCNVLYNRDIGSDLFRTCVAYRLGRPELVENYEAQAITEYLARQDEFEKVLGKLIPEQFRQLALKVRDLILRPEQPASGS